MLAALPVDTSMLWERWQREHLATSIGEVTGPWLDEELVSD